MPTTRLGKVRRWLKTGKAEIYCRKPFTIRLKEETTTYTQPIEVCVDTGYQHIGISVKSEKREYMSEERILLRCEKSHHDDARKYRRTRRNRLRYREPRFDNRKKGEGWFAPSIQNKIDQHVALVRNLCKVMPITSAAIEVGQFDTAVLVAVQEGRPIPEGIDYQHGPRYGVSTLREAVFQRDNYTCKVCKCNLFNKKTWKKGESAPILRVHHMLYWKGQHGNRLRELMTICTNCHTSENHAEGGILYGLDIEFQSFAQAAFMNAAKDAIFREIKQIIPTAKRTYGTATKESRIELGLEKSHVNDAYAMGNFHPAIRAKTVTLQKVRRNNRILEKFYDATYIDTRDGKVKKGAALGCKRTNRKEPRKSERNNRIYRGCKVNAGRRSIRRHRYPIRPRDIVLYNKNYYRAKGIHNGGTRVIVDDGSQKGKSVPVANVSVATHISGWDVEETA